MGSTIGAPTAEPPPTSPSESRAAPVRIDGVRHRFGDLEVLDGLSVDVAAGEVVGLVGPSGCGKSTLLELVAGLRSPSAGTIEVDGLRPDDERLERCAYMPQRDALLPWLTAIGNAALALRNHGLSRAEARRRAEPLFSRFGLGGFEAARPGELSGGMRQRVAFLRTLLAGKPVLLLDEPFASLDVITRGEMQEWMATALGAEPRTVLFVTHDVEEALYLCDRVVVLTDRPARAAAEVAFESPRTHPRLEAITSDRFTAQRERALEALGGPGALGGGGALGPPGGGSR